MSSSERPRKHRRSSSSSSSASRTQAAAKSQQATSTEALMKSPSVAGRPPYAPLLQPYAIWSKYDPKCMAMEIEGSHLRVDPDQGVKALVSAGTSSMFEEGLMTDAYEQVLSSAFYPTEYSRDQHGCDLSVMKTTDGVSTHFMWMEVKAAGGAGDELTQVLHCYRKYACGLCPCLLIAARGWCHPIEVYGAVYIGHKTILYTLPKMFTSENRSQKDLVCLACAIRRITDELETQQKDNPSLHSLTINTKKLGLEHDLTDLDHLYERKLLFKGKVGSRPVLVKICKERYGESVHRELAAQSHAPELIYFYQLAKKTFLIVMELVEAKPLQVYCHDLSQDTEHTVDQMCQKIVIIGKKLKEIVSYMHELGYVHGDIRKPNILVCGVTDSEAKVKLIDFDWAGKKGEVLYPFDVKEAAFECGVKAMQEILVQHDNCHVEYIARHL